MPFPATISTRRKPRQPIINRVAASRAHYTHLRLTLSLDLTEHMGVSRGDKMAVSVGTGADTNRILLRRALADGVAVCMCSKQLFININNKDIPHVSIPNAVVSLPYFWRGHDLIVDLTPILSTTKTENTFHERHSAQAAI